MSYTHTHKNLPRPKVCLVKALATLLIILGPKIFRDNYFEDCKQLKRNVLTRGGQTFSVKGQRVSILSFVGLSLKQLLSSAPVTQCTHP